MTSHPLQHAFRESKPAFGAWITIPSPWVARTAAQASSNLSWLVVDCEHGLVPLQPGAADTIAAVSGLKGTTPTVLVRIPATGSCADTSCVWQIKYVLDSGAHGVIVPMVRVVRTLRRALLFESSPSSFALGRVLSRTQVSTPQQARSIVSAARFPPTGTRGFGSPFTQDAWGISAADYLKRANDEVIVMVQIETREALERVEEICAVDGLDGVFIGPYDLSLSLGLPPPDPLPHPEAEKAIQRILKAAHDAGKKCAFYCITGEHAAERATQGFDMINVTSDVGAMTDAIRTSMATAVGQTAPHVFRH
ncbi:hypothetical protein EIP86_005154 [Pleurotus ostreatoroseus]|nr:hypothetical protein EIP86_005154 [Pleurotus ostreatoroseus]